MKKEFIKLINDFVKVPSVAGNVDAKREVFEMAKSWLKKEEIDVEIFDHKESPSLIATVPGDLNKTVLFAAHLDVVPGPEEIFSPVLEGDILKGRGVIDNKGCAVMLMFFLQQIKKKKGFPTFKLMLTTDEEVGGFDGAGRLAEMGIFDDIDAVFIPDGGNEENVVIKEKGLFHLFLQVSGVSAHGSRPWLGENAIEKAFQIYLEIKDIFKDEDFRGKNHWHATVNLGKLHGGDALNQVPSRAEIGIDIRFTEKHSLKELELKVKEIIAGRAEILKIVTGDLLNSNEKHPLIQKYCKKMSKSLNRDVQPSFEHGASDARFFNYLEVPTWLQYPEGGAVHEDDEWLNVSSAVKMVNGWIDFFGNLTEEDFKK